MHQLIVRHSPDAPEPRVLLDGVDITDDLIDATITVGRYSRTVLSLRLHTDLDIDVA